MELIVVIIALALIEYVVFMLLAGRARLKYKVLAPSTSGDPIFERYLRVQQNTLEQLIVFIPSIWMFATYMRVGVAALLGVLFIIGRFLYCIGYVSHPKKRQIGFLISFLSSIILLVGGFVGVAMRVV